MWPSCIWLLWLVAHQQWHSLHHASSSYRHSSMVSFREEKDCVLLFNNTVFYLTTEASNLFSHLRWRRRRWWALEHFFEKHPSTCEQIENYNRLSGSLLSLGLLPSPSPPSSLPHSLPVTTGAGDAAAGWLTSVSVPLDTSTSTLHLVHIILSPGGIQPCIDLSVYARY